MDGELKFSAIFDYGDAKKSVDDLFDIFEKGQVKINDAFNFGRTVETSNKQLRDMISITKQTLSELEAVYRSTMNEIRDSGGLAQVSEDERQYLARLKDGIAAARAELRGLQENLKEQRFNKNIFAGLTQGIQGLIGAYAAVSGVMAQFGADSEDLERIQTRLQGTMSILMGVQQVYNVLQSTSAFRLQVLTKATQLYSAAQAAMAKTSMLAKLGIAGLVTGVALAAIKIISSTNKIAKANKEANEQYEAISKQTAQNAASQITTFHKLQTEWQQANGNLDEQKRLVAENKDEWRKLGIEVNSINDYEKYAVEQAPQIVAAMAKKAEAAANLAQAEVLYSQAIQARMDAENGKKTKMNFWQSLFAGASMGDGYNGVDTYSAMKKDFEDKNRLKYINIAEEAEEKAKKLVERSISLGNEAAGLLSGNMSGSVRDNASDLAKQYSKYNEVLRRQELERQRLLTDLEFETQQSRINAMQEGTARTLAQINLDFRREEEEITRWYDDLIDEKIARDRELWEADPKNKGKVFDYNREDYAQTEQETGLRNARLAENEARRLQEVQKVFDKYLTFSQQFERMAHGFSEDIAELEKAGASVETIEVASRKAQEALQALAETWAGSEWDDGLVEMGIMLTDLEGMLEIFGDEMPEDQLGILVAQIEALRKQLDKTGDSVEEHGESWTALNKVLTDSAGLFRQVGSIIGGALGDAISSVGNFASSLAKMQVGIDAFKDAVDSSEKITAGMSIASSAISALGEIIGMVSSQIRENRAAQEEWARTMENSAQKMRMLNIEAAGYSQRNIFGVEDPFAKAKSGAEQYMTAMEEVSKMTSKLGQGKVQTGTKEVLSGSNALKGAGYGAGAGAAIGSLFGPIGAAIGAGIGALVGAIGGAVTKEVVPVFESLSERYGQLYDENFDLDPRIIADYEKLDDETKQIVDNWQEIKDKAEQAMRDLESNLSEFTGNIGNQLRDTLVEAWKNRDLYGAIDDFKDYVNDMIADILIQSAFSSIFGDLFDKLEKDMKSSFGIGGDNDITDDIMNFEKEYQARLGLWDDAMKGIQASMENLGYRGIADVETQRNATAGAFQTMSQDTASELNGRFTALQIAGENILLESRGIHADTSAMAVSVEDIRNLTMLSMGHLEDIAKYTSVLPTMGERLERIEKYSKQLVS